MSQPNLKKIIWKYRIKSGNGKNIYKSIGGRNLKLTVSRKSTLAQHCYKWLHIYMDIQIDIDIDVCVYRH